ncbi:S-layer homology domain-containing protein [Paenibacillus sp. FSL K6-3182]|uniref:S-layer homology domain-containing protein n=1 Tax=Paenibacillus sp. FSL K6-3182 TaxID=2921495 RepID=UPI0030CB2F0F
MRAKKWLAMVLALVLALPFLPAANVSAQAQQGGTFVLNPAKTIDNLEMLPAAAAERDDAITIFNAGVPKYFWINNFGERSSDYLKWTVRSDLNETTDYFAWLHLKATAGTQFKLTVKQNQSSTETNFTKEHNGWEVAEVGALQIPPGESTITLTKVTSTNQNISIKGLDMIRLSDKAAYLDRAASYKAAGSEQRAKFGNSGYGLFFQYGTWGYPQFGSKKNAEDSTNDFDVEAFVDMLEDTGTSFVIWSITWWQYRMQMPVQAVDDIMGDSSLTTERNLVGEIAAAAKARGIDFYLYYHQGIQQEPAWKSKQNWPNDFTKYGVGDRSTFINNWEKVVKEIGTTLGTNLDGWFFDDGCVYYPAPFERMALATKAGNPNRIVSYNSWEGTKITEFQDMIFGEGTWGDITEPTANGIFQVGREAGLQQVGMPMLNNDNWGITSQNETIVLTVNTNTLIANVKSASERKVPIALNIKMWEGGTTGDSTIQALFALKKAIRQAEPEPEVLVNDNDARIRYSENTGWTYGPNVYSGYYNNDTHYSKNTEASPSVEFEFMGTGIGVIGNKASWSANMDVYIDGDIATGTITGSGDFNGSPEQNRFEAYKKTDMPYGLHKIKVVYKSGAQEAQLDAFKVYNNTTQPPEDDYPVKNVLISSESHEMGLSSSMQMTASVIPQYASDKSVEWSVGDVNGSTTTLAAIDSSGLLTSNQVTGTVNVIAKSKSNGAIVAEKLITIKVLPKVTTVFGNDPAIVKKGTWTTRATNKSIDSTVAGASASFSFMGNIIEWYGVIGDDHGIADVYIDGQYVTNVDLYSTSRETGALLFRSEHLGGGQHTIEIEVQDSKNQASSNSYVEVYSFRIEESVNSPSTHKKEIKDLIDYVEEQKLTLDYPYLVPVVKEAIKKALEEAYVIYMKDDASEAEITAVYENLLAKVHLLSFTGNKTELSHLYNLHEDLAQGDVPDEVWGVFQAALAIAKDILADVNALQTEIDLAKNELQRAIDRLGTTAPANYTVTFNSNGGSDVSDLSNVTSGSTITAPITPAKTGYTFNGWYKEAAFKTAWNFSTDKVTGNITLHARWVENTPTQPTQPTQPTPSTPEISKDGIVVENLKPNKDGNAIVEFGELDMNAAIKAAEVKKDGSKQITVRLNSKEDIQQYTITIPLDTAAKEKVDIVLETAIGSVSLLNHVVKELANDKNSKIDIIISRSDKNQWTKETQRLVGDRPIVDVKLLQNNKKINATAKVSINYAPNEKERADSEHIVVYKVAKDGSIAIVANGKYDAATGTVTVSGQANAIYAVGFVKKTFDDTSNVKWAEKQISVLASKGIINGTSETSYSPEKSITRANFLKLLVDTLELSADAKNNFHDVAEDAHYYKQIAIARALGLASGVGNNHFNPESEISRQDMIVLIDRALKIAGKAPSLGDKSDLDSFADVEEISQYALESVASLVREGIISGTGSGIDPKGSTTRAQAAVVLYNLYNR